MRILVIGATGFIGSAVTGRLAADGHAIVAVARHPAEPAHGAITWQAFDIAKATQPSDWSTILGRADAVVNCAGILQDGPDGSAAGVHHAGPAALFRACAERGIRRVIHLSAVGVDRETPSEFSRSKLAGDEALMALDLDWIILRPSVVIGRSAYGGSALLRGLAALPILPVMPGTTPIQIVHLDDLVEAIVFFLRPGSPAKVAIDVVGPNRYRFQEVVALLRKWMRWRPARHVQVPDWLADLMYRLGDFAAWLGWSPAVRTTAQREMVRGAVGDPSRFVQLTGFEPRDVEKALMREPASVQERWFARLYLLKPLVFTVFPLFWIATAIVSLGPGRERGVQLVMEGGTSRTVALLATLSGAFADLIIGLLIAFRRTARLGLWAAFLISIAYAIIGTILVPRLWIDPLGPMLKIAPVMVFNLVALAILDDR